MVIDIKTIYVLLSLVSIVQVGIFYQQVRRNSYINGPG
jgi:hypothetical protein